MARADTYGSGPRPNAEEGLGGPWEIPSEALAEKLNQYRAAALARAAGMSEAAPSPTLAEDANRP
jgi:hypothetical protein